MHDPPLFKRCRSVDGRSRQRMTESNARAELDQACPLRRRRRIGTEPEPLGRTPEHAHVAERFSRRRDQGSLRRNRERSQPSLEALLDAIRRRRDG